MMNATAYNVPAYTRLEPKPGSSVSTSHATPVQARTRRGPNRSARNPLGSCAIVDAHAEAYEKSEDAPAAGDD